VVDYCEHGTGYDGLGDVGDCRRLPGNPLANFLGSDFVSVAVSLSSPRSAQDWLGPPLRFTMSGNAELAPLKTSAMGGVNLGRVEDNRRRRTTSWTVSRRVRS